MNKSKRKKLLTFILFIALVINSSSFAFAHSGRTDSNGGHKDNKNVSGLGYYHYHCGGHPPHLHTNGYCPYKTSVAKVASASASSVEPKRLDKPNIKISSSTNYIKISWSKVDHAAKYRIYRSTSKDGKYEKMGETTKLSFSDKSAQSGKTYYYKVKSVTGDSSKYKTSYYSSYVKGKRSAFSGKIVAKWDTVYAEEKDIKNVRELSLGQVERLLVETTGSNNALLADYSDFFEVTVEEQETGKYYIDVSVINVLDYDFDTNITVYFDGYKSKGIQIPIMLTAL